MSDPIDPSDFDNEPEDIPSEPIPEIFHSFQHEGPFEECIECHGKLKGTTYVVHKSQAKGEVIFEFAMCMKCLVQMHEDFSKLSKERIEGFVEMNRKHFESTEECNFCSTRREECGEFSVAGVFYGDRMIRYQQPSLICSKCSEKVQNLISPQTRKRIDEFIGNCFDGPPGFENPIPTDHIVFI